MINSINRNIKLLGTKTNDKKNENSEKNCVPQGFTMAR